MKLKIATLLLFFQFLVGFNTHSQENLDSLLLAYPTASLDNKIKLFFSFRTLIEKINHDTILHYVEDLRIEGREQHRKDAIMMAEYGMIPYLQYHSLYIQADTKLNTLLNYYQKVGNDTMVTSMYNALGNSAYLLGNVTDAEIYYNKSLEAADKSEANNISQMLPVLNLSRLYIQQGKYKKAKQNINIVLQFLNENGKMDRHYASAYGLLGQLYLNKGEYDKAITSFNKSMKHALSNGNIRIVADGYTNLGIIAFFNNELNQSEHYFRLALSYREKVGNDYFIAESYYNLGDFYRLINKVDSSIAYFKKSILVAKRSNNFQSQKDALEELAIIYDTLGENNKQIQTLTTIIALQEEINKQQHNNVLNALNISYAQTISTIKNTGEIREEELQTKIKSFESIFNWWIAIVIGGIGITIFLFNFFKRKKGRKKAKATK